MWRSLKIESTLNQALIEGLAGKTSSALRFVRATAISIVRQLEQISTTVTDRVSTEGKARCLRFNQPQPNPMSQIIFILPTTSKVQ